ncbi:MAG: LCP family protein, partial [Pseudonocardiales bacterium]|nr:LCP family protein [Pseudonocardiales bacterium]
AADAVRAATPGRRRRADPRAGAGRRGDDRTDDRDDDARRIDATLTRLTAAHAGVTLLDDDRPPPAVRTRTRPGIGLLLVGALALLLFAVTAFQYVAKARLDEAVVAVAALDPGSGAVVDAEAQAGSENVLIVGGSEPDGRPRTDTLLLAHVPANGGDVVGLTIPRDLEVNRPPCRRWDAAAGAYLDEIVPAQARTPLVTALDLGGPQCATRVVQQLTGLEVTRYVGIDLDAVGPLVDVLGGVDVCLDRPVLDDVLGSVVPAAGVSRLDGLRSRDLLQARSVQGDAGGDRDVLERQQRVLVAVVDEVLSADVLLDPARLGGVRDALGDALTLDGTDLDRTLATGLALRSFAADGVTFATVPTAPGASTQGGVLLQRSEAEALFAALREGETLPEQPVLAAAGGPSPAEVSVEVLNAADRQGLAGAVGDTLTSLGFTVTAVGNAPAPLARTEIRFSPDRAAAAQVLGQSVPSAVAVPDPAASGLLQLVLGSGFDDVVRAPAASATGAPETPVVRCT